MGAEYTPAQAAATAKYLKQFKQIIVRVDAETFERIQKAVGISGQTQKDFILDAIEDRVSRFEHQGGEKPP